MHNSVLVPLLDFVHSDNKIIPFPNAVKSSSEDYLKQVLQVTDFCNVLRITELPVLKKADWLTTEFIDHFYTVKAYAEDWHYSIYKDLKRIPQCIIGYDKHYQKMEQLILAKTADMRDNPSEITISGKLELKEWIESLETEADFFGSDISLLIGNLDSYLVKLDNCREFISDAYQKAADTKLADESKVEELSKKEKEIQDRIHDLEGAEIAMLVLEGIAGVATVLVIVFAFECMPAAAVMAGVDVAIFLAALAIDVEINKARDEYEKIKADADDYTSDLAELKRVLTKVENLKNSMETVKAAATAIGQSWKDLKQRLNELAASLASDEEFVDSEEFGRLYDGIRQSGQLWRTVVEYADKLVLTDVAPADKTDIHRVVCQAS